VRWEIFPDCPAPVICNDGDEREMVPMRWSKAREPLPGAVQQLDGAGIKLAIDRGWLWKHESGTYVKMTQAGADLFV
jgi:hypothetical protein